MVAVNTSYYAYQSPATQARYPMQSASPAAFSMPNVSMPSMNMDNFSKISSLVGNGAGGAVAAYKYSESMAESMYNFSHLGELGGVQNVLFASIKEMSALGFKGAGVSALISGGVSLVANGVGMAKGTVDTNKAVRNVVGDTISGAVGGLTAVTAGGLTGLGLVKMGVTGLPITIATVAVGAAAGVGASFLKDKIMSKMGQ